MLEFLMQAYKINFSEVTVTPRPGGMPYFDPNYGFAEPRPTIQPPMTKEELVTSEIDRNSRDVCALDLVRYGDLWQFS